MQRLKRLTAGLAVTALAVAAPLAGAWDAEYRYDPQPSTRMTSGDHHAGHHDDHHGDHHGKHHGKHHGHHSKHGHHGKHGQPHHQQGVIVSPRRGQEESVIGHRTYHNWTKQQRPYQRHPEVHRYNRRH